MLDRVSYRRTNKTVYSAKYHLIWCPKYRRRVLVGQVETRLNESERPGGEGHSLRAEGQHRSLEIQLAGIEFDSRGLRCFRPSSGTRETSNPSSPASTGTAHT